MPASRLLAPAALILLGLISCEFFTSARADAVCGVCRPAPRQHCFWAGIYPTVVIPWHCCGGVDQVALAEQIDYQLQAGVHGLLVLGTIGEGEYADMEERAQVIQTAVGQAAGCVPVVAGIHTADLDTARVQMIQAKEWGANAVLIKYTGNPSVCFDQVLGFFHELAGLKVLPIFYYHYPSQTGLKLSPEQVAQILLLDGVIGIKESTLILAETRRHIELTQGSGRIFLSGTSLNLTQFMDIGGHGAMCPEAVVMPKTAVRAYRAYLQCLPEVARTVQKQLFAVAPILRGGCTREQGARSVMMHTQDHKIPLPMGNSSPQARLKATLCALGIPTSPAVKPPLPPLSICDKCTVNCAARKIRSAEGRE